jgi:hypothetical protein
VQRLATTDQVDENGVEKSRRRTSRHSAKEASTMDTEEGSADEDVAVEVTEAEEDTHKTASQTAGAGDIEAAATRKQCSNCLSQKLAYVYEPGKSFLALYQKLLATNLLSRNWDEKQTQHGADVCDYFHLLLF